jgi:photosystem II stability/assembly factor-like uncharacterized protein
LGEVMLAVCYGKYAKLLVFLFLFSFISPAAQCRDLVVGAPARNSGDAARNMVLDAAWAGSRIVAVGDRGSIILSDDNGVHFRQASLVPVDATLTSVSFVDAHTGWVVGQWGVVLNTSDGGEHWKIQRKDLAVDRPLFSVVFKNKHDGWAVGLWSLILVTHDGGVNWTKVVLPKRDGQTRSDLNLFKVFPDSTGAIYVAAERGTVIRTDDDGRSWTYLDTGYKGSFWSGTATPDGEILVAGLRGTIYSSKDRGGKWTVIPSGTTASITDLIETRSGVFGVGLDGFVVTKANGSERFVALQRPDRTALTAVLVSEAGNPILFSKAGVVRGLNR